VATAHPPAKCRYHPRGFFTQRLRLRGGPKDAESMGREEAFARFQ